MRKFFDWGAKKGSDFATSIPKQSSVEQLLAQELCKPKRSNISVASRRHVDEEHLETKIELPIPADPNLVTAQGLALIAGDVERQEKPMALFVAR